MQPYVKRAFTLWIPLAVASTVLLIAVYAIGQQQYRQAADDPQIQLAEDTAALLAGGTSYDVLIASSPLQIEKSLGVWVAAYDAEGNPLASTGTYGGIPPKLPKSLFDPTSWQGRKRINAPTGPETRVTWQPESGTRQAVVLVQYTTPSGEVGYAVSGRSMRVTEERIASLMQNTFIAWILTLGISYAAFLLLLFFGWL